jgi:hypothetical protein
VFAHNNAAISFSSIPILSSKEFSSSIFEPECLYKLLLTNNLKWVSFLGLIWGFFDFKKFIIVGTL